MNLTSIFLNRQLDSRLTKVAPVKTKGLTVSKAAKSTDPTDADESAVKTTIRQNNVTAGKAIPYATSIIKKHSNVQIDVNAFILVLLLNKFTKMVPIYRLKITSQLHNPVQFVE